MQRAERLRNVDSRTHSIQTLERERASHTSQKRLLNQRIEVLQAQVREAQSARDEMCVAKVAAEEQAKKNGVQTSQLQLKTQDLQRLVDTLLQKLEGLAATRATCNARNIKIRRMSEVGTETPILESW